MNKATKKTFTQRELEKILAERLIRERRTVEAFDELRRTLDALIKDGTLNADSYAEAVREICKSLPDNAENMRVPEDTPSAIPDTEAAGDVQPAATDVPHDGSSTTVGIDSDDLPFATVTPKDGELSDTAVTSHDALPFETVGTSPEDDLPFVAVNPDTSESEEISPEGVDYPDVTAATRNAAELCELLEAHPSLDVEALLQNRAFALYRQKYGGRLLENYDGYVRLLDALSVLGASVAPTDGTVEDSDAPSRPSNSARRRLASTSFSGHRASPDSDAGFALTPLQRQIAKSAGISYAEYSAMLNEVPERRGRR